MIHTKQPLRHSCYRHSYMRQHVNTLVRAFLTDPLWADYPISYQPADDGKTWGSFNRQPVPAIKNLTVYGSPLRINTVALLPQHDVVIAFADAILLADAIRNPLDNRAGTRFLLVLAYRPQSNSWHVIEWFDKAVLHKEVRSLKVRNVYA